LVLAVSAFITTANVPPDSSPILAAGLALILLGVVVLRAENQNERNDRISIEATPIDSPPQALVRAFVHRVYFPFGFGA